jgi:hypothetical protein
MKMLAESEDVQGNILAPFPEDHQAFLLLTLSGSADDKRWLRCVVGEITRTAELTQGWAGAACYGLSFTYGGLCTLSESLAGDLDRFVAFREGPGVRARKLGDHGRSAPNNWIFGRPDQPIHAVLTIACRHRSEMERATDEHRRRASRHGIGTVFVQTGGTLPGPMAGREHFGFRDGIS